MNNIIPSFAMKFQGGGTEEGRVRDKVLCDYVVILGGPV
jgi:hypothetical protein